MSRSKRARAKTRRHAAAPAPSPAPKPEEPSRVADAKRRASVVKIGTGAFAAVSLVGWIGLARVTYAGHSKHRADPLAIPPTLYDVVRQNLLQAGIVAPAVAPPDATTASS